MFQVLQEHPDGLAAKEVLRQVSEIVPPTPFEAAEYPNRPGVRRYEKIIRFSTVPFVKAGWLVKTKSTWTATDEGLAAFDKAGSDVESWFRTARAKYREWKKDQPEPDSIADVDETEIERLIEPAISFEPGDAVTCLSTNAVCTVEIATR